MIHVENRVRCSGCNKVFCRYCEDRCPSCYGIHISPAKPYLNYSKENPARIQKIKIIKYVSQNVG